MDIKTKITPEIVKEHGLSEEEYQIILDRLGREPNINELLSLIHISEPTRQAESRMPSSA